MTFLVSSNPFVKGPAIQPINPVGTKGSAVESIDTTTTNPVKQPLSAEKADETVKTYSNCMSSYGMAMLALQNNGAQAGKNNGNNGSVGVETSGAVG